MESLPDSTTTRRSTTSHLPLWDWLPVFVTAESGRIVTESPQFLPSTTKGCVSTPLSSCPPTPLHLILFDKDYDVPRFQANAPGHAKARPGGNWPSFVNRKCLSVFRDVIGKPGRGDRGQALLAAEPSPGGDSVRTILADVKSDYEPVHIPGGKGWYGEGRSAGSQVCIGC